MIVAIFGATTNTPRFGSCRSNPSLIRTRSASRNVLRDTWKRYSQFHLREMLARIENPLYHFLTDPVSRNIGKRSAGLTHWPQTLLNQGAYLSAWLVPDS